jgi:hypothetical protein
VKNPHAVALGRLGAAKGGRARALALAPKKRQEIARAGARARVHLQSVTERRAIARDAALHRWSPSRTIETAADAPIEVRRLLKSYEPAELRWAEPDHRYAIVRAVLVYGDASARAWLRTVIRFADMRELARRYRGAVSSEPERVVLRRVLRLTRGDIPVRPHLGLRHARRA